MNLCKHLFVLLKIMRVMLILFLFFPVLGFAQDKVLRLAVPEGSRALVSFQQLERLYRNAGKVNGLKIEFVQTPMKRSLMLVQAGELDGELLRKRNDDHSNLIFSHKPIGHSIFRVIYLKTNKVFDEANLTKFRGLKILNNDSTSEEEKKRGLKLVEVPTLQAALKMLDAKRVDFVIISESAIDALNLDESYATSRNFYERVPLHLVLNKKHKDLMAGLEGAIQQEYNSNRHEYTHLHKFID
ncbi:substrate-binding periplasmic protein [Bdellovibrio bacteriovorus]